MFSMQATYIGVLPYKDALALQEQFFFGKKLAASRAGEPEDTILFLQHTPVYTHGVSVADPNDYIRDFSEFADRLKEGSIELHTTSRGGLVTYHGPGQLVCYPILNIGHMGVRTYIDLLEGVVEKTLLDYGVKSVRKDGGTWVSGVDGQKKKICSYGVTLKRARSGERITMHGFAFNLCTDLSYFERIYPCGIRSEGTMINLADLVPAAPTFEELAERMTAHFGETFKREASYVKPEDIGYYPRRKPRWIRVRRSLGLKLREVRGIVGRERLHTVCEEASCPNIEECWALGDVTIMILGDTCTRGCGFCAVKTGRPPLLDRDEPLRVAEAIRRIPHSHIVLTSVNRDELQDGGSAIWAETVRAVRAASPEKTIEVLVPDFKGSREDINRVLDAEVDVFGHNIETIERLHAKVRPQSTYKRSLAVLEQAKSHPSHPFIKSNIMVGHGESKPEVIKTMEDLRVAGVEIITLTQYLRPTLKHLPVIKYYTPEEFAELESIGYGIGLPVVVSGPLVRTSYHAGAAYKKMKDCYVSHQVH